ncbi:MAG: hypothetical protein ABR509_05105 [Candidatus Limnocylindria bacterium]
MAAEGRTCIKCGRPIGADQTICEICNRAGMQTPSATQYHGTIVVAIIAGVAALAIAASVSLRGVGPFHGSAVAVGEAAGGGVEVTLEVVNEGSRAGRARCQIVASDDSGRRLASHSTESPVVDGGERLVFSQRLPGIDRAPARIRVDCE